MEKRVKKVIGALFLGVALQSAINICAMDDEDRKESAAEQEELVPVVSWRVLAEKRARLTAKELKELNTMLIVAVEKGDIQAVIEALKKGADVNVKTNDEDGQNSLVTAVIKRNNDMVALLILYGADVNYQTDVALSALAIVAMSPKLKNKNIVRTLVLAGATPHESNFYTTLNSFQNYALSKEMETLIKETQEERKEVLKEIILSERVKVDRVCEEFLIIPLCGIINDYLVPYYEDKQLNMIVMREMARK